ncbi:eukaryotic translation initiation factor 2-alpha kinase, putative (PK4) [Plasmodium ovale wallikeri]|uniref:Eukaryotic translation initiation factor 2-alpha kinase PK4 n=1 Tax=Plasmodium ovale wallikeri TaxID=864142 RepID=A0A1A8Z1J5_PLAOA|nr:eukaryotic translation initiation factor 2-alpha kinase, putative (PK4) [Plasmodium ovale wallikeri]
MNNYNLIKKKSNLYKHKNYHNLEMERDTNRKCVDYSYNDNISDVITILKGAHNKVKGSIISKNERENVSIGGSKIHPFIGTNAENYIINKKMNHMILSNMKNIVEKITSIERMTNVDTYVNMRNKMEDYRKMNHVDCSKRCVYRRDDFHDGKEPICASPFSNRMNKLTYLGKRNAELHEGSYIPTSNIYFDDHYEHCRERSVLECNDRKLERNNKRNVQDDDCAINPLNMEGTYIKMNKWEDEAEKMRTLERECELRLHPCDTTSSLGRGKRIYKRILDEENNKESRKNSIWNDERNHTDVADVGKNINSIKSLKEDVSDCESHFSNHKDTNGISEQRKNNFIICRKNEDEHILSSNNYTSFMHTNGNMLESDMVKEGVMEDDAVGKDDLVVLTNERLNDAGVFPNEVSVEKKNILFPYEDNINGNKTEMNLTKYYSDKHFYGQYKYDTSIFIYDLIVLDTSGYIYKVSTDGTYYWKYKIVKNIHNYVNFEENMKDEKDYNTLRNTTDHRNTVRGILTENDYKKKNNELNLRATKKFHHKDYFDVLKMNYLKNMELKANEIYIKHDKLENRREKKNDKYEKLKKSTNITKKLLSNYNGDLFYVNENNEAIPLNINIKDVVNNSPFKSPLFPNIVFMGSRHSSIINLDYDTGEVIRKYDERYDDELLRIKEGKNISLPNKNKPLFKNFTKRNEHVLQNGELKELDEDKLNSKSRQHFITTKGDVMEKRSEQGNDNNEYTNDVMDDETFDATEMGKNIGDIIYNNNKDRRKIHREILLRQESNELRDSSDVLRRSEGGIFIKRYPLEKKRKNRYYRDNGKDFHPGILKTECNNLKNNKRVRMKKLLMSLNRKNLLSTHSYNNILEIIRKRKKEKKKKKRKRRKRKRKTQKRQLQISVVKWIIKAVDEHSLKKKWITTWVDVGSIFITHSHRQDISFINSLIEIAGNKLILRPLEGDKMNKPYTISKKFNLHEEEISLIEKGADKEGSNQEGALADRLENGLHMEERNSLNTSVKSKIFIFSEAISSVFALKYESAAKMFTLDVIMKQNEKIFPEYENVRSYSYSPLNLRNHTTLFLPFSSNENSRYNDEKVSCNLDENVEYGKKLLHRLNSISVSITAIERDIRYLLTNIIFVYDRSKKIPINYIYKMKILIREYQKTKQQFLLYLPGADREKNLGYIHHSELDHSKPGCTPGITPGRSTHGSGNNSIGGWRRGNNGPIHICEYISKFIDTYFDEREMCFDYCSMLNIWDKIFNKYTTQEDCLLLSNLYKVLQNVFSFNSKEFNYINGGGYMLEGNENFLVKRRKKPFIGSRNQEYKDMTNTLRNRKGWYWNMFYAIMLIFVVPFVFIYRLFKKKKSSNKVIMKKTKLKDYDEKMCDDDANTYDDGVNAYSDDEMLHSNHHLLRESRLRWRRRIALGSVAEKGLTKREIPVEDLVEKPKMELDITMKRDIAKKLQELEQPTLIDILARHARDSDSDSKFYDISETKYNLYPLHYWGGESKYSLPNMTQMSINKMRLVDTNKPELSGKNMFNIHRRRAASQDVTHKQSFVVKKRIRSYYKLGNKYNKKNYTDNEKDKKHNRVKEKYIDEKAFDKNEFINFLTNFNKKFMKKNVLVDDIIKMNRTSDINNVESNGSSSREHINVSEEGNKQVKSDNENRNNFAKKNDSKKYGLEENKITEEKKNKNKHAKTVNSAHSLHSVQCGTHKQSSQVKNKVENMVPNNGNEKMSNKSSNVRNLSIVQTSHIPYDAPLADFLENGRFMRTFENISLIGQGGFGSVYKVSHRLEPGSPTYAVKFIYLKVTSLDNVSSRRYFREIAANRDIYSKHVVRYYTWWCEEPQFLPMHIMPKEIQNLVKKNKDSFKKLYNKNKRSDSIKNEKMSSWENKPSNLKNFKKVIKKKNCPSLKFYSDNDGLNSKRKDENNNNNKDKKKKFPNHKNFSDSMCGNENIRNKKKKKKKKKKKIIYEEKEKANFKDQNEKYQVARGKNNPTSFNSSFQEYDPFDYGYLNEEERDLIVFADNDEPNGSTVMKEVARDVVQGDDKKEACTDNFVTSHKDKLARKHQMENDIGKHVTYDQNICREHANGDFYTGKNAQNDDIYDTLNKAVVMKEKRTNSHIQQDGSNTNDSSTKQTVAGEDVSKEERYNRKKAYSGTKDERVHNVIRKEEINNKGKKEKDKMDDEEDKKENFDKIKSYKKKKMGPEFSIVLLLQMELCKGYTLRKWLDRSTRSDKPLHFTYGDKNMNHPLEFDLFKQLIKGLKDIHATCFIHRDLKPENIFVDPDTYTLKIGDLGLVRFIEEKKREKDLNNIDSFKDNIYTEINQNTITSQISLKGQIIGTPGYTAPEGGALCDEKADIYSAALILLELLCPRFNTIMERYKRLNDFRNYYSVPDYVKIHLNPWYILMLQMSKPNPADRPSAADLYSKIKVLLDPHLTDFAFSFNDNNNDDGAYSTEISVKHSNMDNKDTTEDNNIGTYKADNNGSHSTKVYSNRVGHNDVHNNHFDKTDENCNIINDGVNDVAANPINLK